jgi:hypothetical protein
MHNQGAFSPWALSGLTNSLRSRSVTETGVTSTPLLRVGVERTAAHNRHQHIAATVRMQESAAQGRALALVQKA